MVFLVNFPGRFQESLSLGVPENCISHADHVHGPDYHQKIIGKFVQHLGNIGQTQDIFGPQSVNFALRKRIAKSLCVFGLKKELY